MARQRGIYSFGDFTIPLPRSTTSRARVRQVIGSNFAAIITRRSLFPLGWADLLLRAAQDLPALLPAPTTENSIDGKLQNQNPRDRPHPRELRLYQLD